MELYDFKILPESKQLELVFDKAEFLINRIEGNEGINLYSLGGFFIEVYLDREKNNIVKLRTFKNVSQLEPYLDEIDIEKLIND